MAVEGTLDTFKLGDVLVMVSQQSKTGILTVQGDNDIVAISFLGGQVVAADALTRTVEEGLGDVLVRRGLVARERFDAVAARHQAGSGRLIELLITDGGVGRAELLSALREQTLELLLRLLDWRQGEFKFYGGDEVSFEEGFVPISIEELVRHHYDAVGGPRPPAAAVSEPDAAAGGWDEVSWEPLEMAQSVAVRTEAPRQIDRRLLDRRVAAGLALTLAVAAGALLLTAPERLLFPFPWQRAEREAQVATQLEAAYLKVDRAAKTFFLLTGRFPDRLGRLVEMRLLGAADLAGPGGRPLVYSVGEESYTVRPAAGDDGDGIATAGASEAITGDFLLDPEFLASPAASTEPPLVLLD